MLQTIYAARSQNSATNVDELVEQIEYAEATGTLNDGEKQILIENLIKYLESKGLKGDFLNNLEHDHQMKAMGESPGV